MFNSIILCFLLILESTYSSLDYSHCANWTANQQGKSNQDKLKETDPCGNWTPFKDEKCYKLFKHLANYSDAVNYCRQQDIESSIVIIKTMEEQDAIVKLVEVSNIADSVWLGINRTNGTFENYDKTQLDFKNWAENRPSVNRTGLNCVSLSTDENTFGQWFDEKCQKQNALICQKKQAWSISKLQAILLDTRKELIYMQKNPVPIGFIYVQILGQIEPKILWPNTDWENISAKLAGLFFRVEGGQAAQFGQIQEQQTQSIQYFTDITHRNHDFGQHNSLTIGTEFNNKFMYTGADKGTEFGFKFKHNNEEIRPKNSAIKLWQRIK